MCVNCTQYGICDNIVLLSLRLGIGSAILGKEFAIVSVVSIKQVLVEHYNRYVYVEVYMSYVLATNHLQSLEGIIINWCCR